MAQSATNLKGARLASGDKASSLQTPWSYPPSQLWHVNCMSKVAPRRTSLGAWPRSVFFPSLSGAFSFLLKRSLSRDADHVTERVAKPLVCSFCRFALVHVGIKFLGAFVQAHHQGRLLLLA
jgi:hypothetical protein